MNHKLIVLGSILLLAGCRYVEQTRYLINNYRIERPYYDEGKQYRPLQICGPLRSDRLGPAMTGYVRKMAIKYPYITGYADKTSLPPNTIWREGYFLIDTTTDKEFDGLTEEQWKSELKRINWKEPDLEEPEIPHALMFKAL